MLRLKSFIIFFLIFSCIAVYWCVVDYGFVWDDRQHILENPYVLNPSFETIFKLWTAPFFKLYIPVIYTFWSFIAIVSYSIYPQEELSPILFHGSNVIIHILCTIFLFSILRLLLIYGFGNSDKEMRDESYVNKKIDFCAGVGALFFALHPVQVESVSWVACAKDLLCGLFSLVALYHYIHAYTVCVHQNSKCNTVPRLVLSTIFYILALLSKPTAVTLPVMIFLISVFALRNPLKKNVVLLISWLSIAFLFILVTQTAQPNDTIQPSFYLRPFIAIDTFNFYLFKLLFPVSLSVDYGRTPELVLNSNQIYYSWILPLGLLLAAITHNKRQVWLTGLGFFVAGFLPVSGIISFDFQSISTVADRYLYQSVIGAAICLSWYLYNYGTKVKILLACLIIAVFGVKSSIQSRHWLNNYTLFSNALSLNSKSQISLQNIGKYYSDNGRSSDAIPYYNKALQINSENYDVHYNLGSVFLGQNRYKDAILHLEKAYKLNPVDPVILNNLGNALIIIGRLERGIEILKQAIEINRGDEALHNNLGIALRLLRESKKTDIMPLKNDK